MRGYFIKTLTIIILVFTILTLQLFADTQWKIKHTQWSTEDEVLFGEFITRIGESNCTSINSCLKDQNINPYAKTDPANVHFFSDCADLPYYLRAYFAWKRNLPFSYISEVESVGDVSDIRYSANGNYPVARVTSIAPSEGDFPDVIVFLRRMVNHISSAMYRFHPELFSNPDVMAELGITIKGFTDFYSADISKDAIKPGTIVYDVAGHIAIVYKIEDDGRIRMMDAHPDNSLTRITYGFEFVRSKPYHGAGFKDWRPIVLVDATQDSEGNYIGGKVVPAKVDGQLTDFSLVQFYGTDPDPSGRWSQGKFIWNGAELQYYDYLRMALARGDLKFNPIVEFGNKLHDICESIHYRVLAVNEAVENNVQIKEHPLRLPVNIYGTSGEWESYSSPSRDARLKISFKSLLDKVKEFISLYNARSSSLEYYGGDLKNDLLNVFNDAVENCQFSYKNSVGVDINLNLEDVMNRLFSLSFDPYHCVEHRWGAQTEAELSTCSDDSVKDGWYGGEQFMRNQLERKYEDRMDFTLDQLIDDLKNNSPRPGNGVITQPDVNIRAFLEN